MLLFQPFHFQREWKTLLPVYCICLPLEIILSYSIVAFCVCFKSDWKVWDNSPLLHISSSYKCSSNQITVCLQWTSNKQMLLIKNLINNAVNDVHHNRIPCSFHLLGSKTVKRSRKLQWLKSTINFTWGNQADCIEKLSKIDLHCHQHGSYRQYFQWMYLGGVFYYRSTKFKRN